MEIFNRFFDPGGAFEVLARAGHVLVGVTWIGLLYYFNFVQTPAFAQLTDGARGEALRKITFRDLWWFRWAALATFLFGLLIISVQDMSGDNSYFSGQRGTAILTGMLFGTTMFLNVWGIIWRHQKVIIANAESVAAGGDPRAAVVEGGVGERHPHGEVGLRLHVGVAVVLVPRDPPWLLRLLVDGLVPVEAHVGADEVGTQVGDGGVAAERLGGLRAGHGVEGDRERPGLGDREPAVVTRLEEGVDPVATTT